MALVQLVQLLGFQGMRTIWIHRSPLMIQGRKIRTFNLDLRSLRVGCLIILIRANFCWALILWYLLTSSISQKLFRNLHQELFWSRRALKQTMFDALRKAPLRHSHKSYQRTLVSELIFLPHNYSLELDSAFRSFWWLRTEFPWNIKESIDKGNGSGTYYQE